MPYRTTAKERVCTLLMTSKYEPDMVNTDRENDVTKLRRVSRIHFRFFQYPVGQDQNRSTYSGDFLENAYFRLDRRSNVTKN